MILLKLAEPLISEAVSFESGMDFAIGTCSLFGANDVIVVARGNGIIAPLDKVPGRPDVYTIFDMYLGESLPESEESVAVSQIRRTPAAVAVLPGYVPVPGAFPLLGRLILKSETVFFRFTSRSTDTRFSAGHLDADTYLTSQNDRALVNSGFGAVGRYALPLPLPACFVHKYRLPAGTYLAVGTVAPAYGQAGGGVEVKTVSTTPVVHISTTTIDEF